MSMVTTCPSCQTTFGVTTEQLSAHQGDVRCGRCGIVFNAFDSLAPRKAELPEAEPLLVSEPEQMAPLDETELADDITAALAPEGEAWPEPALLKQEKDFSEAPPAPALVNAFDDELLEEAAPLEPEQPQPRNYIWAWAIGSVLMLVLLLGQASFFYRTEIAANYPFMKPTLEQSCAVLGCTVELPKKPELLRIESSDLESDPAQAAVIRLSALVINQAKFRQAYPSLELTLTDARDQAVARRIFQPAEYLPPGANIRTGVGARGEINVKLDLNIGNLAAAGYRLYVLYP
jgi:predicted Zn finger-like uncharacterized protein